MYRKITLLLISVLSVFLLSSCGVKAPALGQEDEIFVVADSVEYAQLEGVLKEVFGKVIYTPQPEHLFKLTRKSINNLDDAKKMKNVIILAPLNSGSYTSKYLNSILDSTAKSMVMQDSIYVINKYNLWSKYQLVMILTAPTLSKLRSDIFQHGDDLVYYFRDESNKRIAAALFNPKFEQKKVEAEFLKDYGWTMYVQADYKVAMNIPKKNFVWLRRAPNSDMERWVFVHWIDNASPTFLNADSITAERNKMTKEFYKVAGDTVYVESYDAYKKISEVNFNGRYAIMMQGMWRFNDKSGGGPFINYTFFDEDSGRIYMLDGSIFAPKYQKKSIIQQVDVLLHSFKTENELSPEKKKELLSTLNK